MNLDNMEKNIKYPLDLVVIHGSGMEVSKQGHYMPPFDSMLRIMAGVKAYELGWTQKLVFSGGQTFGSDCPSEAQVGINFLTSSHYLWGNELPKIPEQAIMLEEKSKSTRDNIAALADALGPYSRLRVGVCSNDYHLPYVLNLARGFGLYPNALSAETLSLARNPGLYKLIKELYSSPKMKGIERTQRLLRFELLFDPTAKLPALIANLTRS
ncbi:MAG: YdcF family protein [Candidatus Daviesbacteria bacterium]|nr:YdcF family protein [Candidatus Daviesbacteria bacterium]